MKTSSALLAIAAAGFSTILMAGASRLLLAAPQASISPDSATEKMKQTIVEKEREGLHALRTGNLAHFGELTADAAIFVDSSGPAGKAQVLKNVEGFRLTDYSMENIQFLPLSANTGLIEYKISEKGVSHGKEFSAQVYVSSIWAERDHHWVCLFSQESDAR